MAKVKFKVPSDKEIWAEIDAFLSTYPAAVAKIRGLPDRQKLFDEKKAFYLAQPELLVEQDRKDQLAREKLQAKDQAYLELRKLQGKPLISQSQLADKYPQFPDLASSKLTQQEIHEKYDVLNQLAEINLIQKKVTRVRSLSRSLLFEYLSQTYALYRKITKSEVADATFKVIESTIWHKLNIRTHRDSPRASLLLRLVYKDVLDKTIHQYARTFQLANGYDVEEVDFTDFIKQMGGMEKIRKAYATVIAADAGKLTLPYEKDAEYSASLNKLLGQKPLTVVQLTGTEGAKFSNDMFGYFCLVVAHIDPLNQLELYGQWPSNSAIENDILSRISNKQRETGAKGWLEDKARATALSAERLQEKIATKAEKQRAKEKVSAAAANKAASTEILFSRQRATQTVVSKSEKKPKLAAKKVAKPVAKSPNKTVVK
jgi:hypothetical protein